MTITFTIFQAILWLVMLTEVIGLIYFAVETKKGYNSSSLAAFFFVLDLVALLGTFFLYAGIYLW